MIGSILRSITTFSVCLTLAVPASLAAPKKKFPPTTHLLAQQTAKVVNNSKTVGQFLKNLELHITEEQMQNAKRLLSSMGINESQEFPTLKVDGKKVYFDKNNYMIYHDEKTVVINGQKFTKAKDSFDVALEKLKKKLDRRSSGHFALIPEAHAFGFLGGLITLLGAGALGYFVGPMLGIGAGWGIAAGVGLAYAGTWLYQSAKEGEVSCDQGFYVIRKKQADDWGLGSSTKEEIPPDYLRQVFGGQIPPCTSATASAVQNAIKNWGSGTPNPYQQPPGQVTY